MRFSIEYILKQSELVTTSNSYPRPPGNDQDENSYPPMSTKVPFDNPPEVIKSFLIDPFSTPQEWVRVHTCNHFMHNSEMHVFNISAY